MRRALLCWMVACAGPAWAVTVTHLENGATIVAAHGTGCEHYGCAVLVKADARDDGDKPGLRALLGRATLACVDGMSNDDVLARLSELEDTGGRVSTHVDDSYIMLAASGLSDSFDIACAVLRDAVGRPAYPEDSVEAARRLVDKEAARQTGDLFYSSLADIRRALFPADPPWPPTGTPEGLAAVSGDDLTAAHDALFVGSRLVLACVGPWDEQAILDRVRSIATAAPRGEPLPPRAGPSPAPFTRSRVYESRSTRVAVLMLGFAMPGTNTPSWPTVRTLQALVGGQDGRLGRNAKLRQYTQTGDAVLVPGPDDSQLVIVCATPVSWHIEGVRDEIMRSLQELGGTPVQVHELDMARRKLLGQQALGLRDPLGRALALGLPFLTANGGEPAGDPLEPFRQVTPDAVRELAAKSLQPEAAAMALVLPELGRPEGFSSFPELGAALWR